MVPMPQTGSFGGFGPHLITAKTLGALEVPVTWIQNLRLLRQNISQLLRRHEKVCAERRRLWVFFFS